MLKECLLIIDVQNDFLPKGSLAVPDGDSIISFINSIIPKYKYVIATQDWHPKEHISFFTNHKEKKMGDIIDVEGTPQMLWPPHCVQNSYGAEFSPLLQQKFHKIIHKGTDEKIDSYSAFFDNNKKKITDLYEYLLSQKIKKIDTVGLATDYCVKYSALDAVQLGFETSVLTKGTKAVFPQDFEKTLEYLKNTAGVRIE
ncbi:MAG: bifunctional nicotinamidase/pyrazinamidase [Chitinophagaceae bacterium]|nr:bifunctional nicotinamidase/pyrazinamidase [Chitinophagaceae bacterium]